MANVTSPGERAALPRSGGFFRARSPESNGSGRFVARRYRFLSIALLGVASLNLAIFVPQVPWAMSSSEDSSARSSTSNNQFFGERDPNEPVWLAARLNSSSLDVGQEHSIDLMAMANPIRGFLMSSPPPILQISAPECVGEIIEQEKKFKTDRAEHLRPPFEQLLEPGRRRIHFNLASPPGPNDAIELMVSCYVKSADGELRLIRRRGRVALSPGSELEPTLVGRAQWQDTSTLALGDKATSFRLPDNEGNVVDLEEYAGKKNVLLVTYQCFW